ncbi:MAG: 50S ribosomal protein L6 [Candidatus Comchoanobacterales bacterium]
MSKLLNKFIETGSATCTLEKNILSVKGQLGELHVSIPEYMKYVETDGKIKLSVKDDYVLNKAERCMVGTTFATVRNSVIGVVKGHQKTLIIDGVGYKATVKGNVLVLNVGKSHDVNLDIPKGMNITVNKNNIDVSYYDIHKLGDFCDKVYKTKPVEPYKLKGIRYKDQHIVRKAGKAGK